MVTVVMAALIVSVSSAGEIVVNSNFKFQLKSIEKRLLENILKKAKIDPAEADVDFSVRKARMTDVPLFVVNAIVLIGDRTYEGRGVSIRRPNSTPFKAIKYSLEEALKPLLPQKEQ